LGALGVAVILCDDPQVLSALDVGVRVEKNIVTCIPKPFTPAAFEDDSVLQRLEFRRIADEQIGSRRKPVNSNGAFSGSRRVCWRETERFVLGFSAF
jgi:hypothetical protein